jgi:bacterioferritin (cytochrome b1)
VARPSPKKPARKSTSTARRATASEAVTRQPRRLTKPQLIAELTIHSNEEHAHALSLSEQIDFLGGTPGVDVATVRVSKVSKEMLEQDLEGELDAIARYKARIGQAEQLQEYGLRRALEDILMVEEEHARDLQNALDL